MAYILFLDESGNDLKQSPYEVIAGVAIEDRNIWTLIREVHLLEENIFGRRYSLGNNELKAKKILKRKTYRLAAQLPPFEHEERRQLAKACLDDGVNITKKHLTALAQAKLAFVEGLLETVGKFRCKVFASIVSKEFNANDAPDFLRKDYVYLFERYYYFLEEKRDEPSGLIVFDETEKSHSQRLIQQIENYFKKSSKGRIRSNLLIPEPLFVHSDLTTGVQIADIVAYIISWGMRLKDMNKESKREELGHLVELIKPLRYRTIREIETGENREIWSITFVK